MLTDIEIAAQAKMKRITDVAAAMGIRPEELEPYGHYKAKLSDDLLTRLQDRQPYPCRRGQDHREYRLGSSDVQTGKKCGDRSAGAVPGSGVRH